MVHISRRSILSGKTTVRNIPISQEELITGFRAHDRGVMIQNAFPTLDANDREFLLTGITPEEWDETFLTDTECYQYVGDACSAEHDNKPAKEPATNDVPDAPDEPDVPDTPDDEPAKEPDGDKDDEPAF